MLLERLNPALADPLKLEKQPLYSPAYCGACKRPLPTSHVIDEVHAWCPKCKGVVDTSYFQVKAWVVAVTLLLYVHLVLFVW